MVLSALSPRSRHPAPTPPRSHSPEPTPGTSRQAPAANPGKGTPLSSSPHTPSQSQLPTPPPPSHRQFSCSGESGADRRTSASPASAGSCRRAPCSALGFQGPVSPTPLLRPAATASPQSPRSLPQSAPSRALFASRAGLPPGPPPLLSPLYLLCQVPCGAERALPLAGRGPRRSPRARSGLDSLSAGAGGVWRRGCFSDLTALQSVCKTLPPSRGDPASLRPASSGDRRRVLVLRGNFPAERPAPCRSKSPSAVTERSLGALARSFCCSGAVDAERKRRFMHLTANAEDQVENHTLLSPG